MQIRRRALLALFLLLIARPGVAFPRKRPGMVKPTPTVEALPQLTRLRADVPLAVRGARRGQAVIQHISVRVKNVGQIAAQDVEVSVVYFGGLAYPLRGPKKLQPGQVALYTNTTNIPALGGAVPQIVPRCATCRR